MAVDGGHQNEVANVELSLLVEKGSLDVFLKDEGLRSAVVVASSFLQDGLDLL